MLEVTLEMELVLGPALTLEMEVCGSNLLQVLKVRSTSTTNSLSGKRNKNETEGSQAFAETNLGANLRDP